jgi:hypothetical protein
MSSRPIFRKEALDRLSSPEQLDQLMQVTSPRAWIALAAVGVVVLMALLWGIFGAIPTTVETQGVLLRRGGVKPLTAPFAGQVQKIAVMSGDGVEADQELLRLTPTQPGAAEAPILSPYRARVLQRAIREGENVKEGDTLLMLEPLDEPLLARLFVPVGSGYEIQRGMKVRVWPAQANRSEYGYLVGQVAAAVKFPITQSEMQRVVQSDELAHQLSGSGPCLQVVVELAPDPNTDSGYRWSTGRGEKVQLYSGSPCQASVILGEERPIAYVFPGLGRRGP